MTLYWKYAWMHIRSSMQYRLSFFISMYGQFINTLLTFVTIYLLFDRFGSLLDYSLGEVALCFGVVNVAFSLAECFARGFDRFDRLIVKGDFDRLLLRPRSLVLQVLGSEFELGRLGRILFSAAVLGYAVAALDTVWTAARAATVVFMVLGGVMIIAGLFILASTACFFTIQGLEFVNIFTYGGREMAGYPLPIYAKWMQRFFTYVIPFGTINYLPLHFVAGRVENPAYMLMPLLGALFIVPSIVIWYLGSRKYLSTGS